MEKYILVLFILLSFFIRAIPHLFLIPYFGIEESGQVIYILRILSGDFSWFFIYPHIHLCFVAFIHILTKIPLDIVVMYWNPVINALMLIPMFLIAKHLGGKTYYLLLLYPFLDSVIYRSSIFVGSEVTGLFLMFWMFYLYLKKKYVFAIFIPLLFFTHLMVFIVSLLTIFIDSILQKNLKCISLLSSLVGVCLIAFSFGIFPYGGASGRFASLHPDLTNFTIFPLNDILIFSVGVMGTGLLFLFTLKYVFIKRSFLTSFVIASLASFFLSWIFYTANLVSPTRFIIYFGMAGVLGFSIYIKNNRKTVVYTTLISILMMSSVWAVGLEYNQHVSYCITSEEINAIKWLEKETNACAGQIFYDEFGLDVCAYFLYGNVPSGEYNDTQSWSAYWKKTDFIQGTLKNSTKIEDAYFGNMKYAFVSERLLEHGGMIRTADLTGRHYYTHLSWNDNWSSSDKWELIYDEDNVKIYERVRE